MFKLLVILFAIKNAELLTVSVTSFYVNWFLNLISWLEKPEPLTYSVFIWGGSGAFIDFYPDLYIHELPTKHSREWTQEIPKRKNFGLTKYPIENILDPRNTQEKKIWTHKIPKRKNFGPTKYPREKILDPRNTQEKKFWIHEWPNRKHFGPTKYPREKNFGHTK